MEMLCIGFNYLGVINGANVSLRILVERQPTFLDGVMK